MPKGKSEDEIRSIVEGLVVKGMKMGEAMSKVKSMFNPAIDNMALVSAIVKSTI